PSPKILNLGGHSMFTTRWRLFRLLGIPIYVDASWLIILALLTISLANHFPTLLHESFPETDDHPARYEFWIMGLFAAIAFFRCFLRHKRGHPPVARARGMTMRGITLFMFGGVAEIGGEPPSAATEFLVAIAGPIVSVALAIAFWLAAKFGEAAGWSHAIV